MAWGGEPDESMKSKLWRFFICVSNVQPHVAMRVICQCVGIVLSYDNSQDTARRIFYTIVADLKAPSGEAGLNDWLDSSAGISADETRILLALIWWYDLEQKAEISVKGLRQALRLVCAPESRVHAFIMLELTIEQSLLAGTCAGS